MDLKRKTFGLVLSLLGHLTLNCVENCFEKSDLPKNLALGFEPEPLYNQE